MILNKRNIFLVAVIGLLFAGLFYVNHTFTTEAADKEVWISIDNDELETVIREMKGSGIGFEVKVEAISSGIAIARIDEADLETLSARMHELFRKCGGFVLHQDEEDAFVSIERIVSSDISQNFVDYTINNQANVNQMIPAAQEIKVRQTIQDLSSYDNRRHDQPTGAQSAQYIKNIWDALAAGRSDMSVAFFDNTTFGTRSTPQPSVILTIQGTTLPNEIVVLGAHQDSINTGGATLNAPGADDDASGVASITEAIRVIKETNFRPSRTVQFMAYAAEEVGLRGSRNIATTYKTNLVNVIGVLQLDMTNFKGSPAVDIGFITDFTNAAQNQFVRDLVTTYLPTLTTSNSTCNYGCSDHASWTENQFPSSFTFEATFGQHNNRLHTVNDTLANMGGNANHALKFSKLALAYVGELAKGTIPAAPSATRFDFDGDSKADASIFRPGPGEWWYLRSSDNGNRAYQFGQGTDKMVPADFTGDGIADIAFFRPSSSEWFVLRSDNTGFFSFPFGAAGDIPAPGDYDGDGKADPAVFRPSTATWFILRSSDNNTQFITFGTNGDHPIIGDYDNDGKDDVAIYRPSVSQWWILKSQAGLAAYQFGTTGDKGFTADMSGDGTDDIVIWRPSTAQWLVLRSEDNGFYGFPYGAVGDLPAAADFDGDGIADPTVFRPSDATWYSLRSTSGSTSFTTFGANGDRPAPGSFVGP